MLGGKLCSVMPNFLIVLLCALVLGLSACYGSDESGSAGPVGAANSPSAEARGGPTFPTGKVIIDTGDDSVLVDVEIAQTQEQRGYGLMNRDSLDANSGMIFLYLDGSSSGSFYMKNTRIPLSIAFFDVDGKILEILDMEPCLKDPCPTYDPRVSYRGALEVNKGAFERWGVDIGDSISLVHSSD